MGGTQVLDIMQDSLRNNDWLTDETKDKARNTLRWRDLTVVHVSYVMHMCDTGAQEAQQVRHQDWLPG